MTPAQALDQIIPAWQASIAAKYSPAFIINLVSKHRASLEEMVAAVLGAERLKKGKRPKYDYDFAAHAALVPEERAHDDQPDDVVIRRIQQRMTKMVERDIAKVEAGARAEARAQAEADGLKMALTYIRMRAEAILLREAGWDAVPLLRRFPSLVVMARGSTAAIRDWRGVVHLRAGFGALGPVTVETEKKVAAIELTAAASQIDRYAMAFWARARALADSSVAPPEPETTPDLRGVSWRREANLQAMRLVLTKEASEFNAAERKILAGYSGWGGLSIEKVQSQLPPDLIPETFGLIHEYYTPTMVAEALAETLCPLLAELAGVDGVVHALEPSAGIGRLIRAFSPRRCLALEAGGQIKRIDWTAIEYSKVSSTLLRALRPDVDLHHMPFERWIREASSSLRGTLGLVVSNPPYGERGAMAREDPDEFYKEKRAYAYFMRRALDLLIPGGVGVFLVPAGFLSGNLNRALREKLLRRNHLLGAFRLPSHDRKGHENVPGASVVMDMIFWRCRGGELAEVDEADRYIHEGDYFVQHKDHLLGVEDGSFSGEDEVGKAPSWRYKVTGELPTRLPPLAARPVCTTCVLGVIAPREAGTFQTVVRGDDDIPADVVGELRLALELGARVDRYLAALGADEAERVNALWPELNAALRDFAANFGDPAKSTELRVLATKRGLQAAQQILNVFDRNGALISALGEPPRIEPKFTGPADDVVAQAELLFRMQRALTVKQLLEFHAKQGGTRSREDVLAALTKAEWNLDGDAWDQLYPRDAYLAGYELWARHDRAVARAGRGDEQARVQVRRLLEAIKPAVFEDITDIDPRHGYIDLDLVGGWLSSTLNANYGRVELERVDGFVQLRGYDYIDADVPPVAPDVLTFLGYYNHDPEMFRPPQEKRERGAAPMTREERAAAKQSLGDRRVALAKKWSESFVQYIAADPERRESLAHAYNRAARGRIVPSYSAEPLYIARWGAGAPKPRAHQIAGARRVLDLLGGLIAFDVGVGKTYTALMIIARARQEGVIRRPVILVPSSLVWKWHDDILCTLPDYRVLVIGSKRKRISRGDRKGLMTSETDTPQERAQKWQQLQSGQADVVVLSYDALARTRMNEKEVLRYVEEVEAVQRSIALRRRALEEQAQNEKAKAKLSERDLALLEHGVKAWIDEILALPNDWSYDPGVAWDDIGIDMLVVDEAAGFKNLHMPQAREDGVPKFMGGGGDGSDRAWQLDFRAAAVRRRNGGAGIVLLTATPAKNSPLEFYNLIQFIDPTAFTRAGIRDPEQFIDRFLKIEIREVLDSTFEITRRSAVTGFKNLEDLRTLIFRYGEFRTSEEVGLKLPRPVVETITIAMDEVQEAKYRHYVAKIEDILSNPNPDSSPGNVILGLLARLSMIALHGALEDGYDYRTALEGGVVDRRHYDSEGEVEIVKVSLPRPQYASPKLVECAKRVAASPHCGHIIFCEPTAVHRWMIEVLVAHGIPRERIAVLNAAETKSADRPRIAREFNGLSSEPPPPGTCGGPSNTAITPKYDVVIANSVANEGLDLQVRTCSIHHLDLPWTPADLEQRNGRAVRQGNTLSIVQIFYYFADGSTDGYRFSLIDGKAAWLGELIKSQVRDTNNPAAQQQLTPEDILLMISRNKDKTRAMLEDKRRRQAEEARKRIALEATRLYRQAAARLRGARATDNAELAARLREEGELRLADLERVDADAWPWAPWMYAARDHDVLIPDAGAPVYEGLRVARPRAGAELFDHLEFGRIIETDEGLRIGLRAAGSPSWQLVNYTGLVNDAPLLPAHLARSGGPGWPDDDDIATAAALDKRIPEAFRYGSYAMLRWRGAGDAWLEKWWTRLEPVLLDGLVGSARDVVPIEGPGGLVLATGDEIRDGRVLAPTNAGWQRFLALAPASGLKFTALKEIGLEWWDLKVPQNLLSGGKDEPPQGEPPQDERPGGERPRGEPPHGARTEPTSQATILTAEQMTQMQSVLDQARAVEGTPEELDRRVIDNLALTHAAMNDALSIAGASKADRSKLAEESRATAERVTILRGVAAILRRRGYEVALAGQAQDSFNIIGRDGQLLAAASHGKMARYAPRLTGDELGRVEEDLAEARQTIKDIILDETSTRGPKISEEMMLAVWRRARGAVEEHVAEQEQETVEPSSGPAASTRARRSHFPPGMLEERG